MERIRTAFRRKWFYAAALVIGVLYGFGGLVHIGNILGFGERPWMESPLTWRMGDLFWGTLDLIAVVGIVLRAPVGVLAVALAAVTQVAIYGLFPDAFAFSDEHRATLRGMVYFNGGVLLALALLVYFATKGPDRT